MKKDRYKEIYIVFSNWIKENLLVKEKSFTVIKLEFLKFLKNYKSDEYLKLNHNNEIDLIIINWICILVDAEILIKKDRKKGIRYIYNSAKLNEVQKNIIKRYKKEKSMVLILVLIFIINRIWWIIK